MPPRLSLSGLVAAPYTPFHADGTLNPEPISALAELLIESGVQGVFVCGSTGEGLSLSIDERKTLAECWVRAIDRRMPVLIHVGHNSMVDARALAIHAESIHADAIAALAPSYYKPRTVDDLVDFLAPIANAASKLPFYFYHIPSMTNVSHPIPELLRKGRNRIPSFNGLKFTHNDLMELQECLALIDDEFDVVFGFDEMLLAGLVLGVQGAVGSTYNFAAPVYRRVIAAFQKGDLATARKEQRKSVELVRCLYDFGLMRAGKSIMKMMGIDCGPVRAPLQPISLEEMRTLYDRIAHLDVFSRTLRRP